VHCGNAVSDDVQKLFDSHAVSQQRQHVVNADAVKRVSSISSPPQIENMS
jgi:hypothetical protein